MSNFIKNLSNMRMRFYPIGVLLLVLCSVVSLSCTKEDSNLTNGGDELGIPYDGDFDVYGVRVWTPEEFVIKTLYSRIDTLSQYPIKSKEVLYCTSNGEESRVQWSTPARIIETKTIKRWVDSEIGYQCGSAVLYDITGLSDAVPIEALITTNGRVVRRFQSIPLRWEELRCDIFTYTFGDTLEQLSDNIYPHALNTDNLKVVYQGEWDSPVAMLRFTDSPEQTLEAIYCVGDSRVLGGAYMLESACERCHIPEKPEFEWPVGENRMRILNPQQWEFNGLRFSLYNTTWEELGATLEELPDNDFACLEIQKS